MTKAVVDSACELYVVVLYCCILRWLLVVVGMEGKMVVVREQGPNLYPPGVGL
jgi:hypothetical protein